MVCRILRDWLNNLLVGDDDDDGDEECFLQPQRVSVLKNNQSDGNNSPCVCAHPNIN